MLSRLNCFNRKPRVAPQEHPTVAMLKVKIEQQKKHVKLDKAFKVKHTLSKIERFNLSITRSTSLHSEHIKPLRDVDPDTYVLAATVEREKMLLEIHHTPRSARRANHDN